MVKCIMYKLTLDEMIYSDDSFISYDGNHISDKRYEYKFSSEHKLIIFTVADGNHWMGTFKNLKFGAVGEFGWANNANDILELFLNLLNNGEIREYIMDGFKF